MINFCGINNTLSSSCPSLSKPHQTDLDNSSLNSSPTHTDLSSTFDSTSKHKTGLVGRSKLLIIFKNFYKIFIYLFLFLRKFTQLAKYGYTLC